MVSAAAAVAALAAAAPASAGSGTWVAAGSGVLTFEGETYGCTGPGCASLLRDAETGLVALRYQGAPNPACVPLATQGGIFIFPASKCSGGPVSEVSCRHVNAECTLVEVQLGLRGR
jgi:hypothetical protein